MHPSLAVGLRCLVLVGLCAFGVASLRAQDVPVGSCEAGAALAVLETASLSIPLSTNGSLFWDYANSSGPQYLVPRGDGKSPVFSASLWVSGYIGDSLRVAASTYGPWEFWPGPLPDAEAPPTDCSAYDRIWIVSRADVERFNATGETTEDLAEWPHDLGAPVIDGDGIPNNYDLAGGDQPDLLGDVAAFWVMNDAGNVHGGGYRSASDPLGIEVRAHVFAFEASPFLGVPDEPLREASFYRYEIVNRHNEPMDSLRMSLWIDVDLGDHSDDYIGSDTLKNLVYVYNSDDSDDAPWGYGDAPPAWGVQVLRGLAGIPNGRDDDLDGIVDETGEDVGMTSSAYSVNNGPFGAPSSPVRFLRLQQSRTRDGAPLRAFGDGTSAQGERTRFIYPGDPARGEFWSEVNTDGRGTVNGTNDRRMVLTTGPGRLGAGETVTVDFAMPFARGADHLQSVSALLAVARGLQGAFGGGDFPSRPVERPTPEPPTERTITQIRPNPSTGGAEAVLSLPEATHVEAAVVDVLGRRVAVLADGVLSAGTVTLAVPVGLPPGAYVLRVAVDRGRPASVPFTVVR